MRKSSAPCSGCCTVFDAYPKVARCSLDEPEDTNCTKMVGLQHVGRLAKVWNAHPSGSIVGWQSVLEAGFTILDVLESEPRV